MARQGSGSARQAIVLVSIIVSCLLQLRTIQAATYTVGDNSGWTYNVQSWADGKKFKAGDVLVFNYDPSAHDVVTVDKKGFDRCSASQSTKLYNTGGDKIKLKKGPNYYICSITGHCDAGLKIVINAS